MTRGSSYVAQTDVYVHAEERVVTRNDGNLTRAHEAGEGIAICCMASQGHIVGGRTPQSMIKRYIFQLIVSAALGGGVYAAVRALLGSFSNCWCDENSDSICIATYTFDKTTWDACQQGIPDGSPHDKGSSTCAADRTTQPMKAGRDRDGLLDRHGNRP